MSTVGSNYHSKCMNNEIVQCSSDAEQKYWTDSERRGWMMALFFGQAMLYMVRTVVPVCAVAMAREMAWTRLETGVVLAIFFWGYMTTQLLGGWLADRYGGERIIPLAAVAWATSTIVLLFVPRIVPEICVLNLMTFCRFLTGVFQGFHNPSVGSLMSHKVPLSQRGFTFSLQASGGHLGTLLTGSVGSLLLETWNWRLPVLLVAAGTLTWAFVTHCFLVSTFCVANTDRTSKSVASVTTSRPINWCDIRDFLKNVRSECTPAWSLLFRKSAFWAMLTAHYAHGHVFFILLSWLPTFFHDNYPDAKSWVFNVVPWLITIPSSVLSGVLVDWLMRHGYNATYVRKFVVLLTLGGCALCLLLLVVCRHNYVAALTCMATAVAFCGLHSSGVMLNPQDLAPKYGGAVFGLMNMASALPGFVGVYLVGYMLQLTNNWVVVFQQTAIVCLVGALVYMFYGTAEQLI